MKRTFSTLVESVKRKKWKPFVATLCVVVLLVTLAAGCRGNQPVAPDGGGGDSPGGTTTTAAATTATIKDEPLATTTGTETGAITTTTVNTSSADKTETTTQGTSASVTKTTATKTKVTKTTKTTASKPTVTKGTTGKQGYLDTSDLTYTQEDVGKVVGYDSLFKENITVVRVVERFNGSGLKGIIVDFSNGESACVVECRYCHEMPCPDGGEEACSEYNVKLDGSKTCQRCGLPKGDGHNGTCLGLIDWDNGGKITCNHYD